MGCRELPCTAVNRCEMSQATVDGSRPHFVAVGCRMLSQAAM